MTSEVCTHYVAEMASPPSPSLKTGKPASALLSHLCFDGHSYTRLATSCAPLTTLSLHLYPIFPSTRATNQHDTVLLAATSASTCERPLATAFTLALRAHDRRLVLMLDDEEACDIYVVTASKHPMREYCWSTVQLECSLEARFRLTVVDEWSSRVDVSDGEPSALSAPSTIRNAHLSCSSLFVAGSPNHKAPQHFTGHIASLSLSPYSQLPPHPPHPHNTRLPPLPTRSLPLHSLDALLSSPPFSPLTVTPHNFPARNPSPHPPVLACHDLRGGYTDDFHCQSLQHSAQTTAYAFQHWAHLDTLVYFSHHRVTVPPSSHITAAHKDGVRVLGTVLTEWQAGERATMELITRDDGDEYARALVRLCEYHGFDGWLVNIESPLLPALVPVLVHFLHTLRQLLHASPLIAQPLLVWYDSLSAQTGQITYQSHLSPVHTLPFFHAVDALFTDYHWQPPLPAVSARVAGERRRDVYTGVDVWGRGTYRGGGWATREAIDEADAAGTAVALFGCAWTLEALGLMGDRRRWEWTDRRFWLGDDVIEIDVHGKGEWKSVEEAMAGWQRVRMEAEEGREEKQDTPPHPQTKGKEWDSDEEWLKGWALVDDNQKGKVLVTSHRWCRRWREIDLYAHGVTPAILAASPLVITQAYRGSPPDTADQYWLRLTFLSAERVELANNVIRQVECNGEWQIARLEAGCPQFRYIRWEEGGVDAEGWAGHYGARLGRGKIEVRVGGTRSDKAVGREARRRKLPLHLPFASTFNTGSGSNRWRGGRRLRHESQPLQAGEERQADVGQYGVMEDETGAVRVGGEWSNLHEQDVQSSFRDALRAGEMRHFITAGLTEEVAFEGGRSLCFTVRPSVVDAIDSRDFDVFDFDPPPASAPPKPPTALILHLFLKEADGIALRPYLRLHSTAQLYDLEAVSETTWANLPNTGGWCQKVWCFQISPDDIKTIVIRAVTWWSRRELMGIQSYLGEVVLRPLRGDEADCAQLDDGDFGLTSLVAWHLPSPSLDTGLYTVYLAWLPPLMHLQSEGGRLGFCRRLRYEVEVDGVYVGLTQRSLYAMEGVSEKRLREGRWGVRCLLSHGSRQQGPVQTISALMLDDEAATEAGPGGEERMEAIETSEHKAQLESGDERRTSDGSERDGKRRKPEPPHLLALVDDHCVKSGLVGEHGDAIKRQLVAHIRV